MTDPIAPRPVVPQPAVAVAYCAAAAPTWVAFRDGDGSWTRELPDAGSSRPTFSHVFTSDRAAIATLTPSFAGAFTVLRVLYGTPAELATEGDTTAADCAVGQGKTLHGNVTGLETTQSISVSVGRPRGPGCSPYWDPISPSKACRADRRICSPLATRDRRPCGSSCDGTSICRTARLIPTLDFESAEAFDVVSPESHDRECLAPTPR